MTKSIPLQTALQRKAKGRFAFMFLLTILLTLSLSYIAFGAKPALQINNAGLGASVILAADTTPPGSGAGTLKNPLGTKNGSLAEFLNKLLGLLIMIGSIVIVFSLIFAGFKYVTAGGDMKQVEAAHKQLLWTAIGAAILLGARVIAKVIENTVKSLSS